MATRAEVIDRPVAIAFRDPRQGQSVAACCHKSRQHGIYPGMPLSEATSLCPDKLQVYPYDAPGDLEQLQHLATACKQFSPLVGMEDTSISFFRTGLSITDRQPHSLLVNITGTWPLFGDEQQVIHRVVRDFHRRGYTIQLAIAATTGAAWALSHFAYPRKPLGKSSWFTSFPARDAGHPNTASLAWILPSQHTREGLGELSPAALRIAEKTLHQLHQAGIETIATLYQLPRLSLSNRLGELLLKRLDQALGAREECIDVYHPPKDFSVQQHLEHPADNPQAIQWFLLTLLETLTQSLTEHGQGVLQLDCHLQCVSKKTFQTRINLFEATVDASHLDALLQMQWNHSFLQSPVQEIKLVATCTAPLESYQRPLFHPLETGCPHPDSTSPLPRQPFSSRRLAHLVDLLSHRLGPGHVVRPRLRADAEPERSYQNIPWVAPGKQNRKRSVRHKRTSPKRAFPLPATRPLQLLSPPPRITVTVDSDGGRPSQFRYQQQHYCAEHTWGPERIETGWWRGPTIRRDYYRVQTTTGQRFWLFRERHHHHWHLHGIFC